MPLSKQKEKQFPKLPKTFASSEGSSSCPTSPPLPWAAAASYSAGHGWTPRPRVRSFGASQQAALGVAMVLGWWFRVCVSYCSGLLVLLVSTKCVLCGLYTMYVLSRF